ncbi:MAG TPA: acetyl-CoA acetyltransferase [Acidimicrobiales bacterium]
MALDPRTPVIIGVGQWSNRVDRGDPPSEPVDMMAEVLRRAGDDSGAGVAGLRGLDAVRVVRSLSHRYRDPGALVAARLGASPADTAVSAMGGNEPQVLVTGAARDIAAGDADLVAICGAEAWRTRTATRHDPPAWTVQEDTVPPARVTSGEFEMHHPAEVARGIVLPAQVYALFEQAVRHAAGRTIDEHLVHLGELWSRFSAVAAGNPHAWVREPLSPEQVRTASPTNRWITWPYTKVMNANNAVEQAAGLLMASAGRAEALGVPRDRWVFPVAATSAHDHLAVSHRADLHSSPAIRLAARALLELGGCGVDDLAHVDLYSCFPSAVEIAADEIGLGLGRQLTVTGGLSFAGGPWNNYVTHALATMCQVLREDPGALGLVTANGGYVTKHALGLYSTEPPPDGFRVGDVQATVDRFARRDVAETHEGPATIEAWAVEHDRAGEPRRAIAACLTDRGHRCWATTGDPAALAELRSGAEQIGRTVKVDADGTLLL